MHLLRDYIGFLAEGTESKLLLHKNIKTPSLRFFIFKSVLVQALFLYRLCLLKFLPTKVMQVTQNKGGGGKIVRKEKISVFVFYLKCSLSHLKIQKIRRKQNRMLWKNGR